MRNRDHHNRPIFQPSKLFVKKDEATVTNAAEKIFQNLIKHPNGGITLNLDPLIQFRKEIICSRITVRGFEENKEILRELVVKAIKKIKRQDGRKINFRSFSQSLAEQLNEYISREKASYTIIFALHLTGEIPEAHLRSLFFGNDFKILNWDDVARIQGWKDFIDSVENFKCGTRSYEMYLPTLKRYFTPLALTIYGHSPEDAFHDANIEFEILRAILNLKDSFGVMTIISLGPQKALGRFYPPPFYPVFDHSGGYIEMFYNLEPYDYSKNEIPVDISKFFPPLCERITKMNSVLRAIFRDSLLKYVSALDAFDWRNAFLYFWQALENLALNSAEENLKMSEIASRIKNLMGQAETAEKLIVDGLVVTRNRLVHLGKFSNSGLTEVNYIKIVTERALSNFVVYSEGLRNKRGLLNYFADAQIYDKYLKERIANIEYLIETRKKVRSYKSKKEMTQG